MPPARTGVAAYSAALAPALRQYFEVRINFTGEANLYHIGNNPLHAAIYKQALTHPGTVLLHDAVLQHFFLGQLSQSEYIEEFVYNYGEWHRSLAEQLYRERARSAVDPRYFAWPMLRRLCETARTVIVHNPAAADAVKRHAPQATIHEIPHLWEESEAPATLDVLRLRESLGVSEASLLCGIFGHLRETKRIAAVLRVLERMEGVHLLLAGDCVSADLARALEAYSDAPWLIRRSYLPEREFWRYAHAVDLCINLRYPAAAEASGIGVRLMGAGKPVVLTSGPESARFPGSACMRCDTGPAEEEQLAAYILAAQQDRPCLGAIGRAARDHIRANHNLPRVAAQFREAIR